MFSKKMSILIFSFFLSSMYVVGSEIKKSAGFIPDLEDQPNKDFIRIHLPNQKYNDIHIDSPVAYCFHYDKKCEFFIKKLSITQLRENLKRQSKKDYVNNKRDSILQINTINQLGYFFETLVPNNFGVHSSNLPIIEEILNISFVATILKNNGLLNAKNIDVDSLIFFSNMLFDQVYLPSMNNKYIKAQYYTFKKIKS